MVSEHRDPFRIQLIDPPRPIAPVAHQPGLLQHTQMLRHGGPGYRQASCQFIHGSGVFRQKVEDGLARGVAQCGEAVFYVSVHLR